MPGVGDRSLARRVNPLSFGTRLSWRTAADVPAEAITELDGQTSFWDDGVNGENRNDIVIALSLKRQSIGGLTIALLWQNDLSVALARRIIATKGDSPHERASDLHYELQEPSARDYPELALAIARRDDVPSIALPHVRDFLEDAFYDCGIPMDALDPSLSAEINDLINKRVISPAHLASQTNVTIVDVRDERSVCVPTSIHVDRDNLARELEIRHVAKRSAVVLYCDDGNVSRLCAQKLRAERFLFVRWLLGGFNAWRAAGLSLESPII